MTGVGQYHLWHKLEAKLLKHKRYILLKILNIYSSWLILNFDAGYQASKFMLIPFQNFGILKLHIFWNMTWSCCQWELYT